jgi:hypothetical protein
VTWTKPEVEGKLKAILHKNVPYLKMADTRFERVIKEDEISQGVYDSFIRHFFPEMPTIHIDFAYLPTWDTVFDITPSSGDLIRPDRNSQSSIPFLPLFCLFKYKFKYTVITPVLVKITDNESAKIDKGALDKDNEYSFYFPMKLYLCGNQDRRCVASTPVNLSDIIGDNYSSQIYDCEELGEDIIVRTHDDDGMLAGVDVTHKCEGFLNDCYLGRTGPDGTLETVIPVCDDPRLVLEKEGYAVLEEELKEDYYLEKIQEYNISADIVLARTLLKNYYVTNGFTEPYCDVPPGELLNQTRYQLRDKDDVIITLAGAQVQTPVIAYPTMDTLTLVSGGYDVNTVYQGEVVIRPSVYEEDDEEVIVDFDGNPLTHSNYEGVWILGNNDFHWNLSREDMQGDHIRFHALADHLSDEDLEVKSFDNPVMQDGRLRGSFYVEPWCNGTMVLRTATIEEEDYLEFILPEFRP